MFLRTAFFTIFLMFCLSASVALAQSAQKPGELKVNLPDASNSSGRSEDRSSYSHDPMLENLMKMKIRAEEKEHAEFVERGAEVERLSEQISRSFSETGTVMRDLEKLAQLEKVVKKIRKNLGGSDDDKEKDEMPDSNPASVADAVAKLAEVGASLSEAVKTSSRYTVSANSIDNANELLELIGFIRRVPR